MAKDIKKASKVREYYQKPKRLFMVPKGGLLLIPHWTMSLHRLPTLLT